MPPLDNKTATAEKRTFLLLMAAVSLAFAWILLPFSGTIMWGAIIALLFAPVNRWLLVRRPARRTLAALLTLLLVLVIVILPFALITTALAKQAATLYQRMQSGDAHPEMLFRTVFSALPDWLTALLARFGVDDVSELQARLAGGMAEAGQFIAGQAISIGQNTFDFVVSLFITSYLAFFLIRDGNDLSRSIRRAIPLAADDQKVLLDTFATVIRATVKGNLLVAALQGLLGGIAFWYLDVTGALLWGVLMAFLSLLPAVGAGLVWAPVAVYFYVTGAIVESLSLVAYGVLVIGLVDNLLRPVLVGKSTRMPDYLVLITTLGGMAVFGINGFVLGPAIAALFIAVWTMSVRAREADAAAHPAGPES
jgi:predicted PurR-regulated permease PerM